MTGIDLYMQQTPGAERSHFGHVATLDDVPLKVMDTSHKYWVLAYHDQIDGFAIYVRAVADPDNDD